MKTVEPELVTLVQVYTKEERSAALLDATKAWKLRLHLGPIVGIYFFDLRINRLIPTENSKRQLHWRAKDLELLIQLWKQITTNGVYQPPIKDEVKAKLAKAEAEAIREPSKNAIDWAEGRSLK